MRRAPAARWLCRALLPGDLELALSDVSPPSQDDVGNAGRLAAARDWQVAPAARDPVLRRLNRRRPARVMPARPRPAHKIERLEHRPPVLLAAQLQRVESCCGAERSPSNVALSGGAAGPVSLSYAQRSCIAPGSPDCAYAARALGGVISLLGLVLEFSRRHRGRRLRSVRAPVLPSDVSIRSLDAVPVAGAADGWGPRCVLDPAPHAAAVSSTGL